MAPKRCLFKWFLCGNLLSKLSLQKQRKNSLTVFNNEISPVKRHVTVKTSVPEEPSPKPPL